MPSHICPLIQFADCVRSISSTGIELMGIPGVDAPAELLERLSHFDSIASWYGTNRPEFVESVEQLGLPFEFYPALPSGNQHIHVVDFFLELVGAPLGGAPHIEVQPMEHGTIVIHPFSGSPRKNWPMTNFRALADHLPGPVQWCVGPHEQLPGAVKHEDLGVLAQWLAGARLYIGNDAGITHLAAAVGTPVVAIFGPTDPAVWAPRGKHVHIVYGDLENITVDEVLKATSGLV